MKKQLLKLCTVTAVLFISVVVAAQYVLPIRTIDIPATTGAMVMDGEADDSYGEVQTTSIMAINEAWDADNCGEDVLGDANYKLEFQVCWDKTYLYVICMIDDDVKHDWDGEHDNTWQYDNVELFIDLDTASQSTYTDGSTQQMRINRGWDYPTDPGDVDSNLWLGIQVEAAAGVVFEYAMPWDAVGGGDPVDITTHTGEGEVIGFDLSGADSDGTDPAEPERDTNGRQAAWDWDGGERAEDGAYNNRQLFGFATLTGTPISSVFNPSVSSLNVWPNPATSTIYISDVTGTVTIYSVTGSKVMEINDVNGGTTPIDVSELNNGVYFIATNNNEGIRIAKFVVK
jgi:hypothetical protein